MVFVWAMEQNPGNRNAYIYTTGFPHIFKNHFPYLFNTFSILNLWRLYHYFSSFLDILNIMKLNFTPCVTLHEWCTALPSVKFCSDTFYFVSIWNFHTFSILNVHFGPIQHFFKVLKTDFDIQYFFNTFNTTWEPWYQPRWLQLF